MRVYLSLQSLNHIQTNDRWRAIFSCGTQGRRLTMLEQTKNNQGFMLFINSLNSLHIIKKSQTGVMLKAILYKTYEIKLQIWKSLLSTHTTASVYYAYACSLKMVAISMT